MENCLVTKLKATVDNSSLEKLGIIKVKSFNFSSSGNLMSWDITSGKSAKFTILSDNATITEGIGNCTRTDAKHGVVNPKGTQTYNGFRIVLSSGTSFEYEVEKYNIMVFNQIIDTDTKNFHACYSLKQIVSFKNLYGDISNLKNLPLDTLDITTRSIAGAKNEGLVGNVVDALGSNTSLRKLTLSYTGVNSFTIEDFVAAQRQAGRTTTVVDGTDIPLAVMHEGFNKIQYNNSYLALGKTYNVSWTASEITVVQQ